MKKYIVILCLLLMATVAVATDSYWTGLNADGDINNALNWDLGGVPSGTVNSYFISSTNLTLINGGSLSSSNIFFSATNATTWGLTLANPLNSTNFNISAMARRTNTVIMQSGWITNWNNTVVGGSGIGTLQQIGGTFATMGNGYFGTNAGAVGRFEIHGGTNQASSSWFANAANSTSSFLMTGGYFSNALNIIFGNGSKVSFSGIQSNGYIAANHVEFGTVSGANTRLDMYGGTNFTRTSVYLNEAIGATSAVMVAGGLFYSLSGINVADRGQGLLTLSNGIVRGLLSIGGASGASGRVDVYGGVHDAGSLQLGMLNGTGIYNLISGVVSNSGTATVGAGGNGTFNMTNGLWINTGDTRVGSITGAFASATFNMVGGTNVQKANLSVATGTGTVATVNMIGGVLTNHNFNLSCGSNSTAFFTQTGGEFINTNGVYIATNSGSVGTYIIAGGTNEINTLIIGKGTSGTGTVNITGGVLTNSVSYIAQGGIGTANVSGDATTVKWGATTIGTNAGSVGTLVISGGTNQHSSVVVAHGTSSTGTVVLANGVFTNTGNFGFGGNGFIGTGHLIVSNGQFYTVNFSCAGGGNVEIFGGTNYFGDYAADSDCGPGSYFLINGGVNKFTAFTVAVNRDGQLVISNGLNSLGGVLTDDDGASKGKVIIVGGTNIMSSWTGPSRNGVGTNIISGNCIITNTGIMNMAGNSGGGFGSPGNSAFLIMSNGLFVQVGNVSLATNASSTVSYNIVGGTNDMRGNLFVSTGLSANSTTANVTIAGGLLLATNSLTRIGDTGYGTFTVSGGTAQFTNMVVGNASSSTGLVVYTGGTLTVTNAVKGGVFIIGRTGTGYLSNSASLNVDNLIWTNNAGGYVNTAGALLTLNGKSSQMRSHVTTSGNKVILTPGAVLKEIP